MWQKKKLLVLSNFFFCRYVLKKLSAAEASKSFYMRERFNMNMKWVLYYEVCSYILSLSLLWKHCVKTRKLLILNTIFPFIEVSFHFILLQINQTYILWPFHTYNKSAPDLHQTTLKTSKNKYIHKISKNISIFIK